MLTAENYALLLSDLHMPVMDGFHWTRARRKLEARAQLDVFQSLRLPPTCFRKRPNIARRSAWTAIYAKPSRLSAWKRC